MVSLTESANASSLLGGTLDAGLNALSANDSVTFTRYVRLVLPLDGFVFWVRAGLLTPSALFNASVYNTQTLGAAQGAAGSPDQVTVMGSVHVSNQHNQVESESEGVATVLFTAQDPIQQFTTIGPNELWLGVYNNDGEGLDPPVTFAFSARGPYYKQANLYHYTGTAVLPAFQANMISEVGQINNAPLYISNSLPAWLALSNYDPPYDNGINCHLPLYPSFLVPDNLQPPYGVVHIEPNGTQGHQAAPLFDRTLGQTALSQDRVRVTLYGLTNDAALMFLDAVLQYSYDYETIGMANMPVVRDEKRIQPEMGVVALKKTIEFEVWYNQASMRNVARQQIQSWINNYLPQPLTAEGFGPPAP
jgi:hypothetical protein